jgi:hypothetical protein
MREVEDEANKLKDGTPGAKTKQELLEMLTGGINSVELAEMQDFSTQMQELDGKTTSSSVAKNKPRIDSDAG